ncbi:hypothetical protein EJ04DRAFT_416720, partial [Polyplosphaeria fusca]
AKVAADLSTLQAISFRVSSTTTAQLPQQIPAIAASLANCKDLLSSPQANTSKTSSEAAVGVHKFRTLLSTLLQDRTPQGRWSAIVLIKAAIEVGGWETLSKCLPWVRGLLGILSKPDPPSSKKLAIITLTRIFMLTRDYPTLTREITTPSLPAYVQSCLQLASSKAAKVLSQPIFESFGHLLPRHPTIFRSYIKQIREILAPLIAPTPSNRIGTDHALGSRRDVSSGVSDSARRLYVQLPSCAPKGGVHEEWEASVTSVISAAHHVADKIFRAVVEDHRSGLGGQTTNSHALDGEVQDLEGDALSLPAWSGIYAGGERLVGVISLLRDYLASTTAGVINLKVGRIMDLLTRILSLTVPSSNDAREFSNAVRFNNQISKEEREQLWALLPSIHVACLQMLLAYSDRCAESVLSLLITTVDQLTWVFARENNDVRIRATCYEVLARLLSRAGTTLPKSSIDSLSTVIRSCCDDIVPQNLADARATQTQTKPNGKLQQTGSSNADAFLTKASDLKDRAAIFPGLQRAAHTLLPILFTNIRGQHLSDSIRARLDRTAILAQQKEAMIASVLNPPPRKKFGKAAASILPLLARAFPHDEAVEALLRPRMPVIRTLTQNLELDNCESEADDDDPIPTEQDEDRFMGDELDNLL